MTCSRRSWKALATTGVANLNRSDKIVSTDANVNKWEPKDDDRTEALNKLREKELRRQLESTLAVLKDLANAVVLRMFTIMPRTTPAPAAPSKPPAAGGNPYPEINRRGARSNPPRAAPALGAALGAALAATSERVPPPAVLLGAFIDTFLIILDFKPSQ